MNLTIKSLKTFATDDGGAFDCVLVLDGKNAGTARNDGLGAPTWVKLSDDAKAKLAGLSEGAIEQMIYDALVVHEKSAKLKRLLSKKILARCPDKTIVSWEKKQKGRDMGEAIIKMIPARYPDYIVLNTLPFDEAFAIFIAK